MTDTICDTKLARGQVEIRTGIGRRRRWTAQEKGRMVGHRAGVIGTGYAGLTCQLAGRHNGDLLGGSAAVLQSRRGSGNARSWLERLIGIRRPMQFGFIHAGLTGVPTFFVVD